MHTDVTCGHRNSTAVAQRGVLTSNSDSLASTFVQKTMTD